MEEPSLKSSVPAPAAAPAPITQRLVALDALRGFDMLIILGVEELAAALAKAHEAPWTRFLGRQLEHAEWEGFRFLDLVFPLFVFVSGVSLVYSAEKSIETRGRASTIGKFLIRGVILYALGLLYYHGVANGWGEVRWVGVIQRIAVCGTVAGVLYCLAPARWRKGLLLGVLIGCLAGYWAVMTFLGGSEGVHSGGDRFAEGPQHNFANWVDQMYLPGKKWDGTHDPEGLLSTIPAIGTCLIGVLCGMYLKRNQASLTAKSFMLVLVGAALAGLGWAWSLQFPVIKKLWTSSYVLVAGGYSMALLGAFVYVIEVWGWRWWARPLVWVGMNAIVLYMARHFVDMEGLSKAILGGPVADAVKPYGEVVIAAGVIALNLLLAWFLYTRKIFLRV